jgi:hypothetical protein
VPLDENLKADGPPGDPEPYDESLMQPLPVEMLPERITIAASATDQQILAVNSSGSTVPGVGDNLSTLAGMDPAAFCPYLTEALAAAGMTRDQYLAQLQQAMDFVPADSREGLEQVEQMISACP